MDVLARYRNTRRPRAAQHEKRRVVEFTAQVSASNGKTDAEIIEMVAAHFARPGEMPKWLQLLEVDAIYDPEEEDA
jgi:hypothetical protein